MMGKEAWVAGADRGEAPGPKPGHLGRRLRLRHQPPGSWQFLNGGVQRGVSQFSARKPLASAMGMNDCVAVSVGISSRGRSCWWRVGPSFKIGGQLVTNICSLHQGVIPKRGDFDSTIRSLPGTTCDTIIEDPRSAFNFAGKIHLPTTVSGESSVSENLAPDALEN